MTRKQRIAVKLYLFNLVLLITHEIDSAFWHEWNLFSLPGGIGLFLILNFVLILVFIYGFERVVGWHSGAKTFSYILAAAGIFAFCIHLVFILTDHAEFRSVISIAILSLTLLTSAAQIIVLVTMGRGENSPVAAD